jgi:hypothetical protein
MRRYINTLYINGHTQSIRGGAEKSREEKSREEKRKRRNPFDPLSLLSVPSFYTPFLVCLIGKKFAEVLQLIERPLRSDVHCEL